MRVLFVRNVESKLFQQGIFIIGIINLKFNLILYKGTLFTLCRIAERTQHIVFISKARRSCI
jgi:hypothetical protein